MESIVKAERGGSARRSNEQGAPQPAGRNADIVICVHDALDDLRRCLASVMIHTAPAHRVILVDDASGAECRTTLERFVAVRPATILLRNDERRGYTHAANQGLRESRAGFVVLLNSDTIVTSEWLERMLECASSDPRIGIVGPLSNAATFQSAPERFNRDESWSRNPLSARWTPDDVAARVAMVAPRAFPRVGVLNGFCFGISRAVIDAIGFLDEDAFPDAYGEEQDYCLRASRAGFALAVADHAYVYHVEGRSYGSRRQQELKKSGTAALARKHGGKRVSKAFAQTYNEPVLAAMRDRIANVLREEPPMHAIPRHGSNSPYEDEFRFPQLQVAVEDEIMINGDSRPGNCIAPDNLAPPAKLAHGESPADRLLGSFLHELDMQCSWAEFAYASLVMALNDRDAHGFRGPLQQQRIFFYAHAFLTHAAIISTMLWPSDQVLDEDRERVGPELAEHLVPMRQERGRNLRKALGIKKSSRLMDERLRDYLQHHDSRVELWGMTAPSVPDMLISPADADHGAMPCQAARHFDPITMIFSFHCEEFDLPAFAKDLARLHRSIARKTSA
ncbi:MAG: glycosyltransferase family 2 protein [Thermomicrobiales bacterium]